MPNKSAPQSSVPVAQGIERLPSNQARKANLVNSVNNLDLLNTFIADRKGTKGLTAQGERWVRQTLGRFLAWLPVPISETRRDHLVTYLARWESKPWQKHSMFRALRTFWKWASIRYDMPNPMLDRWGNHVIDAPKTPNKVLYTQTPDTVHQLMEAASCTRDKAIISLLADSGARLGELASISFSDLDLDANRIKVLGKGGKEGYLVFGSKTKTILSDYIRGVRPTGLLFGLNRHGINTMLQRLGKRTGIKANAHSFRRGFATELRRQGVGVLDIKELGRWSSVSMVERYTRAFTFDDAVERYKPIVT